MAGRDNRRLARCIRRLEKLRIWRNAREDPIEGWLLTARDGTAHLLDPGESWPIVGLPVHLTASTTIPYERAGQPVELELSAWAAKGSRAGAQGHFRYIDPR